MMYYIMLIVVLDNLMSIKVSTEINLKNIAGEYHYVF
jgi:hypothetical protein